MCDGNLHLLKLRDANATLWDDLVNDVPNHVKWDGDATVGQQRDEIVKSHVSSLWIEVVIDQFANPLRNTLLRDNFDCLSHLDDLFQDLRHWLIVNLSGNTLRKALLGNDLRDFQNSFLNPTTHGYSGDLFSGVLTSALLRKGLSNFHNLCLDLRYRHINDLFNSAL